MHFILIFLVLGQGHICDDQEVSAMAIILYLTLFFDIVCICTSAVYVGRVTS